MSNIGWDDQGDRYSAWDRIRDERRAEQADRSPTWSNCTKGACQRHARCMYLNHPRCPLRGKTP